MQGYLSQSPHSAFTPAYQYDRSDTTPARARWAG